jgi:pSer/pThr/pTyr-binding forkhead associated (FHA) protein
MAAKLIIASGKRAGRAISMKRDKLLIGQDLRSRNGTFVNGLKLTEPKRLADGDLVRVGSLELKVSAAPEPKFDTDEDISQLLLGGDPPAGMHDTTRSIRATDDDSSVVHGAAEPQSQDAAAETTMASKDDKNALPADKDGDSDISRAANSTDPAGMRLQMH